MVKLSEIIDYLEIVNNETSCCYSSITKKITFYNDEEELEETIDSLIQLPTKYDINEYSIMEDFINTIEDETIHNQLSIVIDGSSAFRRFKNACLNYKCIDDWYAFKKKRYKVIAIDWCKRNNIEYEDDVIC